MARPSNVDKKVVSKFPGDDAGKKARKKSKPKRRPGTRPKWEKSVMRAIKKSALTTAPSIPRAAYKRIFTEIGNDSSLTGGVRWKKDAINVLIAASEAMVGNLFEKSATLTDLRGKKTISLGDLKSVRTLETMGNH